MCLAEESDLGGAAVRGERPVEYFVGADAERFEFRQDAGGEVGGGALCVGDEGGDFLRFGKGLVAVFEFVLTGLLARIIKLTGVYPEIFGRWARVTLRTDCGGR